MPMLTGMGLAITIDVLIRVSFVLAVSLMLAYTTRWNAALRHAILVAGLAAVFIVPGATLAMRGLPVPRWQLGWLSRAGIDGPAEIALVSPQPPNEPQYRPARRNQPAPAIVRTRRDEARLDPGHGASAQSDKPSLGPRAWSRWNALYGRLMASCLLWTLLSGAIVKVIGLGLSLVRLRRIVARAHPVTGDHILSVLELIQGRIPMRQPPRLLESAEVSSPVAAGIIGNYVLLPTGWAGNLLLGETLAVLGHESAHLARRDHHVVIFQELLASLLWFHPLVHRLNRMLNRVREELCDNYAISLVDRASYCEALLHLAVGRPGASLRGATSMWPGRWSLEDRVRGILDERRPTDTRISNVARSATAICSLAMCGFIALPQLTASPPNDRFVTVADGDSPPRAKASLVAHEMTRSITRAFPVTGEKMLRFENLAGRVELVPGKRPTVEVEATVRVGGLAEGDVRRLIDEIGWVEVPAKDGGSQWGLSFPAEDYPTIWYPVSGEAKADSDTVHYLGHEVRIANRRGDSTPSVEFDLRISLPPGVHVAVDNAVGPIGGKSVDSPLKLSTRHGAIKLGDVRAPIDAATKFGDVLISRLDADAVVQTGSGGIELSRVTQGHVALSTGSGHCRVVLPPESGFRLHYSGTRPLELVGGGASRLSALSGDRRSEMLSRGTGGPSITVTSDTGDTVIEAGP
ncbi:M56 family metallopeptidase [Singulisphaera acidiphila]|uniref:Antirepressor regulating drug resistance protein n=1 Tax=Singulisphaera acidiphila (strain ATCC BAA-1392 / DSM 18658 / VKM B-2454 / MOB10) TaxID=886293 RepID=L0DIA5_SINAD|nr:M56 family metallopeptidase [Singulisphaera acidiphila]AGA28548.1 antirepressor regulating drug resistance protein [Singulisphaera acidiphila DSM 18658]